MNSYLGQAPVFGDFPFQILTGDGTSFYELNFKTNGTNGLLVFLNGAVQRPGIDFTCDGNALTFSSNVSLGVQIFVYGMGLPKSSLAPSAGSVGNAELDASLEARIGTTESQVALQALTYTTAVSASGTAVDLTGIPATVKRITVILRYISSAGGNQLVMQLGTSAGVDTAGTYRGSASAGNGAVAYLDAWALTANTSSTVSHHGTVTLARVGADNWVMSGCVHGDIGGSAIVGSNCGGSKLLSGPLTRIRLAWAGFTDTFDAGQVTLLLES